MLSVQCWYLSSLVFSPWPVWELPFCSPGRHAGVFTPEDAVVAAANTCIMMMFIWAAERFKLKLLSYDCKTKVFLALPRFE